MEFSQYIKGFVEEYSEGNLYIEVSVRYVTKVNKVIKAREVIKMQKRKLPTAWDEKKRLWLKCLKCNHKWYPDARKWKDKNENNDEKVVRCPKCHAHNRLPPATVRFLKRQALKYPEIGQD